MKPRKTNTIKGNIFKSKTSVIPFGSSLKIMAYSKINGKEPGQPKVSLTQLKKDKGSQSWFFEKYYNMTFVDKNPDADDDALGGRNQMGASPYPEHRVGSARGLDRGVRHHW